MADDRREEIDQVRAEAEEFLAPLMPMLDTWQEILDSRGIVLKHQLLVGPHPYNAPQNPVKAGLMVSVKGKGVWQGGSLYAVENYAPNELDWLAATIEYDIEKHLDDPEFGCLRESIFNMQFQFVHYDREQDHEHCACCNTTIATKTEASEEEETDDAYLYFEDNPAYEIWLCPRCFDYWAPRRNLTSIK